MSLIEPVPEVPIDIPNTASPAATQEAIDHVFEYAWHRCNAFDERSGALKKRYRRIREAIILLTWLTTTMSVLSALAGFTNVLYLIQFGLPMMLVGYTVLTMPYDQFRRGGVVALVRLFLQNILERRFAYLAILAVFGVVWVVMTALNIMDVGIRDNIFLVTLVILPLLSTGLLSFASRFEAGVAWVGFRLVAETVRRKIYEVRVQRSMRRINEDDLEGLRTVVLEQRTKLEEMGIATPMWGENYEPGGELVRPAWIDDERDDGYALMTIDDYVNMRLVHQTNYYRKRIKNDFNKTRSFRAWILFIGASGAFLAAMGLGEFVAVTVAAVGGLQAWLSLREHEQSYNIHGRTLLQLEDRIASYHIKLKSLGDKQNKTESDWQAITSFVASVENILDEERSMWKSSVLQGQEATEASLTQLVSSTQPDWEIEPDEEDGDKSVTLLESGEEEASEEVSEYAPGVAVEEEPAAGIVEGAVEEVNADPVGEVVEIVAEEVEDEVVTTVEGVTGDGEAGDSEAEEKSVPLAAG